MTDITAAMIERACKAYHLGIYGYPCLITDMQRRGMEAVIREVLRPMEEAQTADTYRIKPLEWEEDSEGHPRSPTPFGHYWMHGTGGGVTSWGYSFNGGEDENGHVCNDEEDGKERAESHWRALLLDSVLEEV